MPPLAPAPPVVAPAIAAPPIAAPVPSFAQPPVQATAEPAYTEPATDELPADFSFRNEASSENPEPDLKPVVSRPFASPSFARFDEELAPALAEQPPRPSSIPPATRYFEDVEQPSRFAHEPPFRARRNPAKLWTMAAVAFALVVAAAGGAIWYFGVPVNGFATAVREPDLKIILNENLEMNRRDDGTPYFIASGSIVNPTANEQNVPEMLVTLKDASGRAVYSWKMRAKTRTLAPGDKIDFSEARLDIPLAARQINIGWVLNSG